MHTHDGSHVRPAHSHSGSTHAECRQAGADLQQEVNKLQVAQLCGGMQGGHTMLSCYAGISMPHHQCLGTLQIACKAHVTETCTWQLHARSVESSTTCAATKTFKKARQLAGWTACREHRFWLRAGHSAELAVRCSRMV